MKIRAGLFTFVCLIAGSALSEPASITGVVSKVQDADSITVSNTSIRLQGIDAPELGQDCLDQSGQAYSCGQYAAGILREMILGKSVRCQVTGIDSYQRTLAICYRGGVNLNQYLVAQGWAVAFEKYDTQFVSTQRMARLNKKGLWQGDFVRPDSFRAAGRATVESEAVSRSGGCLIKGNINRKGDRIYHMPGSSKHYADTRINEKRGEKWFCSEQEAIAAGWRAPRR